MRLEHRASAKISEDPGGWKSRAARILLEDLRYSEGRSVDAREEVPGRARSSLHRSSLNRGELTVGENRDRDQARDL